MKRFWWLPVLLAILLGAAGAYLANKRKPTYTATTKITVGSVNYRTQSVPGFVLAAQTLAGSYALTVRSAAVLRPLARTEHMTEAQVGSSISATAVPNSTLFSISATQPTSAKAIKLVNDAAKQAQRTVAALNTTTANARGALRTYRRYARQVAIDQAKLGALRARKGTSTTAIENAQTAVAEARALAGAYSTQYQVTITGDTPQTQARTLTIIQPALSAHSDRKTYIEKYGALGIGAGLVLGVLLVLIIPGGRKRGQAPAVAKA